MKFIITENQNVSAILRRRFTQQELESLSNEFEQSVKHTQKKFKITDIGVYIYEYSIDFARDVVMEKLIEVEPTSTDPESEDTNNKVELLTDLLSKYLRGNFRI